MPVTQHHATTNYAVALLVALVTLIALLTAAAAPRRALAQCAAATLPTAPIVPAETIAPVLVTLPPPGAATPALLGSRDAAAPTEVAAGTAPEPLLVFSASPCATSGVVVQQSVVVHVAPAPPQSVAAPTEPTPAPADPEFEPSVAFEFGGLVERADFGGIGFTFDSPAGVAAVVRALHVDLSGLGDARVMLSGASIAISGRPQPWLRGPEVRLSLGSGSFDDRLLTPAGAPNGVSLALGNVLAFRLEGAFGVQHDFGPLGFFAVGRIGWGAYFVSARTQEVRLGDLGEETLSAHRAELGTTVGVSLLLGGVWHLEAAWRRTFTGATGDGLLVGLSAELPADE